MATWTIPRFLLRAGSLQSGILAPDRRIAD